MNSVYIHIGTHKTGTSAIQDFCSINKKALKRNGFLYPQKSRRDYYSNSGESFIISPDNLKNYQKITCLCQKKNKNVLLSSETFSLLSDIQNLTSVFENIDSKVICYLRRQDNVVQSMFNQAVKKEGYFGNVIDCYKGDLNYYEMLKKWSSVFGKENLLVRVYDKRELLNGDLIEDFLDCLNLELTEEYKIISKNANPRLPPLLIEYMRYVNCLVEKSSLSKKLRQSISEYSRNKDFESSTSLFYEHSILTNEQRRSILDQYSESNALVASEYLGRVDGKLFIDDMTGADKGIEGVENILTDEMIYEITRFLCLDKKNKKVLLEAATRCAANNDPFVKKAHSKISQALKQCG